MADDFGLSNVKKLVNGEELLAGHFGIEVEGLRVDREGNLSLKPHPKIFGNKLTNPFITTDFSESQIEIITPAFDDIDEAFDFFTFISDLVNVSIDDDEYIWFQSLPCILPKSSDIPIARYEGDENAQESMDYRRGLAKKYGLRKQLISGIHFNFSFTDDFIKKLYGISGNSVIAVKDDGPGFGDVDPAMLFERFFRTDFSRARNVGGSGLGLAIVKSIVEAHDGTVEAYNLPEGGACFIVAIPSVA